MNTLTIAAKPDQKKILWWVVGLFCLSPICSPFIALILGMLLSNFVSTSYQAKSHKWTKILLNTAIVGMGFGMSFKEAMAIGGEGFGITAITISVTLVLGLIFTKVFKLEKEAGLLIACGTAICGGSAIAAVGTTLDAKKEDMSIALGTVFTFNAIALVLFPLLGHLINMSQTHFGWWCAMAIHDTSSVVGAASVYGDKALKLATTVKLARALWIIPVCIGIGWWKKTEHKKLPIPLFLVLFIAVIFFHGYLPYVSSWGPKVNVVSKHLMTLALFWVGTGLHFQTLKKVGWRSFAMGLCLWVIIGCLSLFLIW
ncbi:YeiH family protein [Persicobacter psychrovividus]